MIGQYLKLLAGAVAIGCTMTAHAGEAEIIAVNVVKTGAGVYRFDVTVRHGDTGWNHYADGWEVLSPDGQVLGQRVLLHPHVEEQPFTRSLGGVAVPAGTASVDIRVHDKVHGYASKLHRVHLPK